MERIARDNTCMEDVLSETQKRKKISNLLYDMSKRDKTIINLGNDFKSKWALLKQFYKFCEKT